ncbi:intradiol ring-cleavage dioxygenase, partial [bacterium]
GLGGSTTGTTTGTSTGTGSEIGTATGSGFEETPTRRTPVQTPFGSTGSPFKRSRTVRG